MPWEKAFDREEALEKAMMLFWRNGYENTSMADLVEATGASRYGLYDEFGDKHALYLAALAYYDRNPITYLLGDLEKDGAGLAELFGYRDRLVSGMASSDGRLGCFMALSATDLCPRDPAVCGSVNAFFTRVLAAFRNALENAKADGDWVSTLSADEAAQIILGAVEGAAVFARANVAPEKNARMLSNLFAQIVPDHSNSSEQRS